MKKYVIGISLALAAILIAVAVYAWAYDTDGGYNVWQQGTCMDQVYPYNHTDVCMSKSMLKEFYPWTNPYNFTYCAHSNVTCSSFNATCRNGKCVRINVTAKTQAITSAEPLMVVPFERN